MESYNVSAKTVSVDALDDAMGEVVRKVTKNGTSSDVIRLVISQVTYDEFVRIQPNVFLNYSETRQGYFRDKPILISKDLGFGEIRFAMFI